MNKNSRIILLIDKKKQKEKIIPLSREGAKRKEKIKGGVKDIK